jgi:TonB family protein
MDRNIPSLKAEIFRLILVRPMRALLLTVVLATLASDAVARPSDYFYRVSPANEPLKKEFALYAARPDYPMEARRQNLTGSGLFTIHVRTDGGVARVEVVKSIGHALLDQAAIAAFRQWRFRPRSTSLVHVPIRYSIGPRPHDAISHHEPREFGDGVQIDVSIPRKSTQ